MELTTNQKGAIAEVALVKCALEHGLDVYRPIAEGRYPVILTYGVYAKGLAFQDGYPLQWERMVTDHPEILEGSMIIGDNAYERGRPEEFANCYDPTWGAFKSRTRPSPGNHEYYSNDFAAGYFAYFKVSEYYSFDLGNWHLVSLDSMIDMSASSDQVAWLRGDLASNSKPCVLAYWHHPRFSSGVHGFQRSDPGRRTAVLWTVLAEHHATLILNGHDHDYERFTPRQGIREIVAGTGGGELRPFIRRVGGSEARDDSHYGVLLLTLHPNSYEWHFIGTDAVIYDRSDAPAECSQ